MKDRNKKGLLTFEFEFIKYLKKMEKEKKVYKKLKKGLYKVESLLIEHLTSLNEDQISGIKSQLKEIGDGIKDWGARNDRRPDEQKKIISKKLPAPTIKTDSKIKAGKIKLSTSKNEMVVDKKIKNIPDPPADRILIEGKEPPKPKSMK